MAMRTPNPTSKRIQRLPAAIPAIAAGCRAVGTAPSLVSDVPGPAMFTVVVGLTSIKVIDVDMSTEVWLGGREVIDVDEGSDELENVLEVDRSATKNQPTET